MLTTKCIHPEIIAAVAHAGHGDKILIADGNFPLQMKCSNSKLVYLGLERDLPTVPEVLEALKSIAVFEKAEVMMPEDGQEPQIFSQFRASLDEMELSPLGRCAFYDACGKPDVILAIATGESRTYANLLVTIGVC